MKLLIQRVSSASVTIHNKIAGQINKGFSVFIGFTHTDTKVVVDKLTEKLLNLRIFADDQDKMNLSLKDTGGQILIISQFTLYADCKKGNRPSFTDAAKPEQAEELYNYFIEKCKASGLKIATGEFGTYMQVSLINDGPVTILLEE